MLTVQKVSFAVVSTYTYIMKNNIFFSYIHFFPIFNILNHKLNHLTIKNKLLERDVDFIRPGR